MLDRLEVIKLLHRGDCGEVRLARATRSSQESLLFAVKSVSRSHARKLSDQLFPQHERQILLLQLSERCPAICRLLAADSDEQNLYLITEYCPGGDLGALLDTLGPEGVQTSWIRAWLHDTLAALTWLHAHSWVHRDLKPSNLLIAMTGQLRLTDFGSAAPLNPATGNVKRPFAEALVGTVDYISPHMLRAHQAAINRCQTQADEQSYGAEADLWSLGVMMYEIIVGACPFYAEDVATTYDLILEDSEIRLPSHCSISQDGRDLLQLLLTRPGHAPPAHELARHPFVRFEDPRSLDRFVPEHPVIDIANLSAYQSATKPSTGIDFSAFFSSPGLSILRIAKADTPTQSDEIEHADWAFVPSEDAWEEIGYREPGETALPTIAHSPAWFVTPARRSTISLSSLSRSKTTDSSTTSATKRQRRDMSAFSARHEMVQHAVLSTAQKRRPSTHMERNESASQDQGAHMLQSEESSIEGTELDDSPTRSRSASISLLSKSLGSSRHSRSLSDRSFTPLADFTNRSRQASQDRELPAQEPEFLNATFRYWQCGICWRSSTATSPRLGIFHGEFCDAIGAGTPRHSVIAPRAAVFPPAADDFPWPLTRLATSLHGIMVCSWRLAGIATLLTALALLSICRHRLVIVFSLASAYTFDLRTINEVGSLDDGLACNGTYCGSADSKSQQNNYVIPNVFHSILLGPSYVMRPSWQVSLDSCRALHPTAEFKMWTDESAAAFVAKEYPELLRTWLSYGQTIQRSNTLRYMLLARLGGIYMDLDLACRVNLDPLRRLTLVTPPATPTGRTNAFIAAIPNHPYMNALVSALPVYNLEWFFPYATNMFSTGCLYFSAIDVALPAEVRRSMKILPGKAHRLSGHTFTPLFEHLGASTWHSWDSSVIMALGHAVNSLMSLWLPLASVAIVAIFGWHMRSRSTMQRHVRFLPSPVTEKSAARRTSRRRQRPMLALDLSATRKIQFKWNDKIVDLSARSGSSTPSSSGSDSSSIQAQKVLL
ncbi:glycosyltransferase family 32 protein [Mixia osmundae IAM 14324]|uniref:Protein kinase domain-containing protein n=1 Tax=Mixia osmundae (strain CBS 9802 / IAM 14324 / JCM 22182 / KY 12970) TaxID=764103 RepID=G7E7U6_MIXOS|nr:glycosyltransferase family 32 protein [Mixia osmundae IAM 14324]KEI38507.1 glycosyltransferase family 32 protein [Mixia osmundae IAM 14324]GAA98906.1 hypothetical protein E5Q_05594 [Mixia osmundae IAM 14324]